VFDKSAANRYTPTMAPKCKTAKPRGRLVAFRVSEEEFAALETLRGELKMSDYLRRAAIFRASDVEFSVKQADVKQDTVASWFCKVCKRRIFAETCVCGAKRKEKSR
jgi:hypothetical protein